MRLLGRRRAPLLLGSGGLLLILLAFWLALDSIQSPSTSQPACSPSSRVSYPAPELALQDLSGRPVRLEALRGKVVLVNLWATWCPPCRREMPALQQVYQRYRQEGFAVVAINIGESVEQVQSFVRQQGLEFAVWSDPHEASLRAFKTISLPSSFAIDRQGNVRHVWFGALCADSLQRAIVALLSDQEVNTP